MLLRSRSRPPGSHVGYRSRSTLVGLAVVVLAAACGDGGADAGFTPSTDTSAAITTSTVARGGTSTVPVGATDGAAAVMGEAVRVVRLADGDSGDLEIDGMEVEFRLLGLNAPERDDCGGDESKAALAALVDAGTPVAVGDEVDRFGRRLLRLVVDGVDVNRALVAQGWALGTHADDGPFVSEMITAAEERLGWWGLRCGTAPPLLAIGDHQVDPDGPDRDALVDEWVEVRNVGDVAVELEGWSLRDETTGHRYRFGPRTLAPVEGVVRLRTGCGEDHDRSLFWCERFPVWSNGGETILLLDPTGSIVDYRILTP